MTERLDCLTSSTRTKNAAECQASDFSPRSGQCGVMQQGTTRPRKPGCRRNGPSAASRGVPLSEDLRLAAHSPGEGRESAHQSPVLPHRRQLGLRLPDQRRHHALAVAPEKIARFCQKGWNPLGEKDEQTLPPMQPKDYSEALDWPGYFGAVRGKGARETLVAALDSFEREGCAGGLAVDVAAGEGRDSLELLTRGWRVVPPRGVLILVGPGPGGLQAAIDRR